MRYATLAVVLVGACSSPGNEAKTTPSFDTASAAPAQARQANGRLAWTPGAQASELNG